MSQGRILGAGIALLVALEMAIVGCGSGGEDTAPPFSLSEAEVRAECLTGTFVPEEAGFDLLQKKPPSNWRAVEGAPRAMQAERGAVLVTLRPRDPGSRITVTGIRFDVDNLGLRPIGTVFYKPCGRRLRGAVIEGDLDRDGRIHKSDSSPAASLGKGFFVAGHAQPIHFPWTISLQRPLRLYLTVEAYDIWAKWSARISWESGSSDGVAKIDNGGRKFEIVDGAGSGWYRPSKGAWKPQGSSRWIGVK